MSEIQNSIIECINGAYYELTVSERRVADYVLAQYDHVQFMSITQLAEECGVADATVSRFCRSLGLKGFNAFKIELAKQAASLMHTDDLDSAETFRGRCQQVQHNNQLAIQQTMELVDEDAVIRAIDLLDKADRVICMGQGGSMILANECSHLFSTVSNKFFSVWDSHTQVSTAATMSSRDIILLFSYSGSTQSGLEILRLAKQQGATTILVTRFRKSPAASLADVTLCCGSMESPMQLGSIPARVAQLVLVDILYQEFCRKDPATSQRSLEQIAAALATKHI
jgi:DNA-binding MurR/RpiR family transcriptional regulator